MPLSGGANDIEIKGYNAIGQTAEKVTVLRPGARLSEKRGRLYVVAIGVDDYRNFKQDLKFAGADARAFDEMLVAKGAPASCRDQQPGLGQRRRPSADRRQYQGRVGNVSQCRA